MPANQFQTIRGAKASTSRRLAVFVPDFLSRYDPDPLRYYLSATMPETSDSDFTWTDFVRRNNDELVATWGNLVNRVLTFTYRNFDRSVPDPGELDARRSRTSRKRRGGPSANRRTDSAPVTSAPASRPRCPPPARPTSTSKTTRPGASSRMTALAAQRCSTPHSERSAASTSPFRPTSPSPARPSTAIWATKARYRPPAGSSTYPQRDAHSPRPGQLFKKLDMEIVEQEEARMVS